MEDSHTTNCKWKPRKVSAKRDFPDAFRHESGSQFSKTHKAFDFQDHVTPDDFIPLETDDSMDSYPDCKWKPRKVSAKRDFPDGFKAKKHKVCESTDDNYQDHENQQDFIPLEIMDYVSSECSETRGSGYYDVIPRLIKTVNVKPSEEELSYNKCSEDDNNDDEDDGVKAKIVKLRFHGACLKELRCYQTENELKIEFSVDNLRKNVQIDVESLGKESRKRERVIRGYGRGRVPAVRCFPPRCGPKAAFATD